MKTSRSPVLYAPFLSFLALCGRNEHPGDPSAIERVPEEAVAPDREACSFARGAYAAETLGAELPVGDDIPIDHFFVFMQENRSFDHYFGTMPGVDGLPEGASNPDAEGRPVAAYHATQYCIPDTEHGWFGAHVEWNGGTNDGFVIANDPGGERAMGHLDATDLPYYHALYRTFAMSDRHFSSVLGPTWVNRWYLTSGTSFGKTSNGPVESSTFIAARNGPYVIFQELDRRGIEWRVYYADVPFAWGGYSLYSFSQIDHFRPVAMLAYDLGVGDVAPVTFIDPAFLASANESDEHPPANPQRGQAFVAGAIASIMTSAVWPTTAILLTYDEDGGFYDHVPPPPACIPDELVPVGSDGRPMPDAAFDRYGFRVPLVVVSPFAKRGYVSHTVTDHASVLRLLEARFDLPALTRRDANAWPLLDLFDFENPDYGVPVLPEAVIDPAQDAICRMMASQ